MKKILLPLILFILVLSPLLSAIQFDMKENFSKEEVLMARLSGEFIDPPLKENIFFYRGHVRIAIDVSVAKIGDDYYIYAPLSGKEANNYSIVIEDISYMKGSQKITEDLIKNFTISDEYVDFTVNPGFISTKDDFSVTLENLKDESIIITMNISTISGEENGLNYEDEEDYEFTVKPGKQTVDFNLVSIPEATSKLITFSYENLSYDIPVSIFIDEMSIQSKIFGLDPQPKEMEITMPTFSNLTRLLYIYNAGTGLLTDIKLSLSDSLKPYVRLSEDRFGQILPDSNANLNVNITSGQESSIGGKIIITTAEGVSEEVRVSIKFEPGYEMTAEESGSQLTTDENCESSSIGGRICLIDKTCDGEEIFARNGLCCVGVCKKKPSGAIWTIIGIIIFVALIAGGVWFYLKKYKGVKNPVDLLKIAKGKKQQ